MTQTDNLPTSLYVEQRASTTAVDLVTTFCLMNSRLRARRNSVGKCCLPSAKTSARTTVAVNRLVIASEHRCNTVHIKTRTRTEQAFGYETTKLTNTSWTKFDNSIVIRVAEFYQHNFKDTVRIKDLSFCYTSLLTICLFLHSSCQFASEYHTKSLMPCDKELLLAEREH